jgi:hypothetical protein
MDNHINDSNEHRSSMVLFSACNAAGVGATACVLCSNCNKRSKISREKEIENEMQQGKKEKEKFELKEI